jgi:dTDP-4-dehydrorhamnose 3,5-epimerase
MKKPSEITVEDLKTIPYRMRSTFNGPTIHGMKQKDLRTIVDGRGDVIELWSLPWVEAEGLMVPQHAYQSATDYGVVKCWHLHEKHTDQFTVTRGKMQVTCVDIREDSPSYGDVNVFITGIQRPQLILIPPGVMHGWKALSMPETIVVNFQTIPYDAADEFKFPWDCVLTEVWEPKNG